MGIIFGQQDYSQELGTGSGAGIAEFGCALTCVASVDANCFGKNTDPLQLNQALINVNGFVSNGATAVDILDWSANCRVYTDITLAFNNAYSSTPADMNLIDSQLQNGKSVIVGVDFNHNASATQPSHYVEIYRKNSDNTYECRDPWFKDDVVFDTRYAVNGMSVEQCILQAVSYNGTVVGQGTYVDANTFTTLVSKSTNYDSFVAGGYKSIDDVNSKITSLNSTIDSLNSTITDKNTTISELQGQVGNLDTQVLNLQTSLSQTQSIAKKVPVMQEELNQATSDRDTCLNGQEMRNRQIGQLQLQLKTCQTSKIPTGFINRLLFLLNR